MENIDKEITEKIKELYSLVEKHGATEKFCFFLMAAVERENSPLSECHGMFVGYHKTIVTLFLQVAEHDPRIKAMLEDITREFMKSQILNSLHHKKENLI